MLFTITGKHIAITDTIRAYAEEKTAKLSRYYDGVSQVDVLVDSSQGANRMSVEIIARGEHGVVFVATEAGESAFPCIDGAAHKLEQQLRRRKAKERDDKHMGPGNSYAGPLQS